MEGESTVMTVSVEVIRGLPRAVDRQRAQKFSLPETTLGEEKLHNFY